MDKQEVCHVCGKEYWPNQAWLHKRCTVFGGSDSGDVVNEVVSGEKGGHLETVRVTAPKQSKPKFDRVAYQREYMRRRRGPKVST